MQRPRFCVVGLTLIALALGVVRAHAQAAAPAPEPTAPPAGDTTRAEQLFKDGVAAAKAGDHRTACAKFAASLELVTRASTLLNLAQCEADNGRLASALQRYRAGVALLPPGDPRLDVAIERMEAIGKRVPRLTITLADAAPTARVLLDDVEVPRSELRMIAVDPGEHVILVALAGHEDRTARVLLREGERKTLALSPGRALTFQTTPPPAPDRSLRTVGFAVGAVGVAGAIVAALTGGLILANDDTIAENCPDRLCNAEGRDTIEENEALIVGNYVAWAVAIAGIGTGAALIIVDAVTAERAVEAAVAPRPGGAEMMFGIRF
jgi:hypothetical protein